MRIPRRTFLQGAALAGAGISTSPRSHAIGAARNLKLTFACGLYDRTLPLYRGEVQPKGVDLDFIVDDSPRDLFDRMGRRQEFHVSEFSASEFITRVAAGASPFVAIPIFTSRNFRHGFICINRRSGIRSPKDLEGRRIGIELYTETACVYIRGFLQHQYGVDLRTIRWLQGSLNEPGAWGHPNALPLLRAASIENNTSGNSLTQLLEAGAIDAVMGATLPSALGRNGDVVRLIPNAREVEKEYYRRTHIFPIMHLVVIRKDTYSQNPWVATSMFNALAESKGLALKRMRHLGALAYMLPWLEAYLAENDSVFGDDPWPYGIEANRPTLEALVDYLADQAMIPKRIPIDALFVPLNA